MRLPLRPSLLKLRRTKLRYIIIHHTAEIYKNPNLSLDNQKYQMRNLINDVLLAKDPDINYNYIIENVENEFQVYTARPYQYLCEWEDIPKNINNSSLHIGILGNYNLKFPNKRMYEILAYRLLNPLLKLNHLNPSRIKLHREVSLDTDMECPGYFMDKAILESMVRRFIIK